MSDQSNTPVTQNVTPWFTERTVDVVQFRINRRPFAQGNLLATSVPESFADHLVEALLFGEPVRIGKVGDRSWRLGNRRVGRDETSVSGLIGWETEQLREEDFFDATTAQWISTVEAGNRVVIAPFVIVTSTRTLFVAKHNSYAESTIATVFRTLLNLGEEDSQEYSNTSWDVEPILDEEEFEDWLRHMTTLDKITFVAKLPNPDAEDAFMEAFERLDRMNAGEMRHTLKSRDPNAGLTQDFTQDRLSHGLLEMAKRGYADLIAFARDHGSRLRRFIQKNRTRREPYEFMSGSYVDARDELVEFCLDEGDSEEGISDYE